ncbi:DedA family protein [Lichenifustis flavocetrariae]|uniref:DedA family protein n=1 Tax=Lichenifustis flavocetrariae TaxID=2949735 RepID=A0AA41Z9S7_9HYPH|nr:DedA family protein [Lichenifustis flavocetrariae]MCW6513118.1 DedA family protein [Lichenifustis flavocetrariae]
MMTALASGITSLIAATGYAGVLLLMAIESACVPLPSEVIMPFAGSLVPSGRFWIVGLATAGALGCNLGSSIAYLVGARGGRPAVERFGRFVLLTAEDLDWSERFSARCGGFAVFVARLLPVVRTFIALPAGMARMPALRFHLYTFAGSWLWCLGPGLCLRHPRRGLGPRPNAQGHVPPFRPGDRRRNNIRSWSLRLASAPPSSALKSAVDDDRLYSTARNGGPSAQPPSFIEVTAARVELAVVDAANAVVFVAL